VQIAIKQLRELGPLPPESTEDIELIQRWQDTLALVSRPVNASEAEILCTLFGSDSCFGGAWSLVHLIETATDLSDEYLTQLPPNEWIGLLRVGRENAKKFGN
jgi:hypothetical protein